jgi:threonine dehydratase
MKQSFESGQPVKMLNSKSIAAGLAPPMAGGIAYYHCKKYVKDILLVSDEEIKETCKNLFEIGIKAELSGCAALAGLKKCPELLYTQNRALKVVVLVSGGNVTAQEMAQLFS